MSWSSIEELQYQVKALNSPDRYANLRWRIIAIFKSSDARYGYRRIHTSLRNEGVTASEKVVARIMKEESAPQITQPAKDFLAD